MELREVYKVLKDNFKGKAVQCSTTTRCSYRNEEGQKCVIGCFLPDDIIDSLLVDNEYINEAELPLSAWSCLPSQDLKLLRKWQDFHDNLDIAYTVKEQVNALFNYWVMLNKA
jgi:hypothetical protein